MVWATVLKSSMDYLMNRQQWSKGYYRCYFIDENWGDEGKVQSLAEGERAKIQI